MPGVIGLDVGGVNTKAAWQDGDARRTVLRPYDVVREPGALAAVLRDVVRELHDGPAALVAVTMTAELSDEFATKREGVAFVLGAVEAAVPGRVAVLTTAGELVGLAEARARPLDVAAANRTDLDRLLAGELVYTGVLRTPLAAIAQRVPVRGAWCPVASERFAISGDVHLVLGHLAPGAYTWPTPDGRPASVEAARARIARLVCADAEQLEAGEIDAIAAHLCAEQVRQVETAARQAAARTRDDAPVVALGTGAFLARAVAARLARPVAGMPWSAAEADVAPAVALAELGAAAC